MNVRIEELPAMRVGAIRHVGSYNNLSAAFANLAPIIERDGLLTQHHGEMIAFYHDDPAEWPASALRADVGVSLDEATPSPEGLTEVRVSAGSYACATLVGPYVGLGASWAELLGEWLRASGKPIGPGAPFEVYRTKRAPPARELCTDLYVPVSLPRSRDQHRRTGAPFIEAIPQQQAQASARGL